MVSGVPPRVAPRLVASNTQTSARGIPGVVSCGSPGRFCPRWAAVMKARLPPVLANTMSRGSSPTRSVRVTRGGLLPTSTMLIESERWLTTQTSVLERAATATGSSPTGTEPAWVRPAPETEKISRRLSGVLVAKSRVPSGDRASGRTCPVSHVVNAATGPGTPRTASTAPATQDMVVLRRGSGSMAGPPSTGWLRGGYHGSRVAGTPFALAGRPGSPNGLSHVREDPLAELAYLLQTREIDRQERQPVRGFPSPELLDHLFRCAGEDDRMSPRHIRGKTEHAAHTLGDAPGVGARV